MLQRLRKLLIVVSRTSAILTVLSLPLIQRAREEALRTRCKPCMHNLKLAVENYYAAYPELDWRDGSDEQAERSDSR